MITFLENEIAHTVSITLDGTLSLYENCSLTKSYSSAKDKIDAVVSFDDTTIFTTETEAFSLNNSTGVSSPVSGVTATQKMDVLAHGGDCVYAGSINGFINKIVGGSVTDSA